MLVGVPAQDALFSARCMVDANLRGMDGQGARRLRQHVAMILSGTLNPRPRMHVVSERRSTALLDGDYGLGFVVGIEAMRIALKKAGETGLGVVTAKNTNDFGMAANYAMLALEHDCIGIVMANTLPWVAPYGGKVKILGTNPICIAIPTEHIPFVFDFSTSYVSHSKIEMQKEQGNRIPSDWALDSSGNPTTDPVAALKGALSPLGGYKGFGLSLIVDIMSGALSGMDCGSKIEEISLERKSTNGQMFLALKVSAFQDLSTFVTNVDRLLVKVKSSALGPGQSRIVIPGELALQNSEKRSKEGVSIPDEIWADIVSLCKENSYDIGWVRMTNEHTS